MHRSVHESTQTSRSVSPKPGLFTYGFPSLTHDKSSLKIPHCSCASRPEQCCCSKCSSSPLPARLLALPWKRPFFPAPFPWSSSNTLQTHTHTSRNHRHRFCCQSPRERLRTEMLIDPYRGPRWVTCPHGPASRNKPGPFSSPTVRKTNVS